MVVQLQSAPWWDDLLAWPWGPACEECRDMLFHLVNEILSFKLRADCWGGGCIVWGLSLKLGDIYIQVNTKLSFVKSNQVLKKSWWGPLGQLEPHGTLSFGICQITSAGNWCPPNPLLLLEGKVVHDSMHLILCKGKFLFPSMECCLSWEPVNLINFLYISYVRENTMKWHTFCEMVVCQPNSSNSLMSSPNPRKLQSGWASYIGISNCWTDMNILFNENLLYM